MSYSAQELLVGSTRRTLVVLAVASSVVFACLLGVRTLTSPDLGYHLAYGDRFWDAGELVDHDPYVYTLSRPDGADRPAPGPGCWYDEQGRYRFVNANWLTQVIMSGVYRLGDAEALCALQAALGAGVFILMFLTMRRLGVPWLWASAGVVLAGLTAYERLGLRPELFGYLLLAAEACALVPGCYSSAAPSRLAVAGLIVLQWLLVNLHSYFLLGLCLTAAVLADRLLRLAWWRLVKPHNRKPAAAVPLKQAASRLAIILVGQAVVCLANPWTWRLALLPIQTVIFMQENGIAGSSPAEAVHPWAIIGEFFRPFATVRIEGVGGSYEFCVFEAMKATYAYCVLLALAGMGAVGSLLRRRWDWLMILGGMTAVSLSMRRNIAPAAVIIVPIALAAVWETLWPMFMGLPARVRRAISWPLAGAVIAFAGWMIHSVVTQRFYYAERSPNRFGCGISRLAVPASVASWLDKHLPGARLWCDYNSSSNLRYFTNPHRDIPVMTNTWAYPPVVMQDVLDYSQGRRPFAPAADAMGVQIVCLRVDRVTAPLGRQLMLNPAWALVRLDGMHAVFTRTGDGRPPPATPPLTGKDFATRRLAKYKAYLKGLDPVPASALYAGATAIYHLAAEEPDRATPGVDRETARRAALVQAIWWDLAAINMLEEALALDGRYHEARSTLGVCLARRGTRLLELVDALGAEDRVRSDEPRLPEPLAARLAARDVRLLDLGADLGDEAVWQAVAFLDAPRPLRDCLVSWAAELDRLAPSQGTRASAPATGSARPEATPDACVMKWGFRLVRMADAAGRRDLERAQECFRTVLADGSATSQVILDVRGNLRNLQEVLDGLQRGQRIKPRTW